MVIDVNVILLQIVSLVYVLVLNIFYFSKKRFNSLENRIYKCLLLSNVVGLLIELGCFYTVIHMNEIPYINSFVTKLLLIYYLWFISLYTFYVFVISYKTNIGIKMIPFYKKVAIYCFLFFGFSSSIISYLPMYYYNDGIFVYSYGPSVELLKIILMMIMTLWLIIIIKKYKNIKTHKYLPVILFIILAAIAGIVQNKYPYVLLTTPVESLIIFLMYFTIENPDMKLLKEMHKAKEISDNANEEKTMFLYNMTQEIRNTTDKINDEADIILDSDSLEQDKDSARNIKGETAKFRSTVNDIMDVSVIDTSSIKIYNSKYNIKNLLKETVSMYNGVCMNKGLEFRTNIEHDIPELLYGDSIGLKKSIMNILNTSIKNTLKGYIEFNVNTIKKNDICRLIITIEDSGIGIKSSELEKIKIDNKNISLAYKLITLMNGTMVISSDYGIGSKIKIVLDQRVVDNISRKEKQYNEVYNNKKILIVDDSEAGIKIIEKLLKGSNIIIDKAFTGRECLDKIRSKNKYDVILLDEELSQIKGYELLIKLKEIRSFNIPVILLSKDNSYEYNEEYKKLGFSGILIKPIKKEILITNIDKFMKK